MTANTDIAQRGIARNDIAEIETVLIDTADMTLTGVIAITTDIIVIATATIGIITATATITARLGDIIAIADTIRLTAQILALASTLERPVTAALDGPLPPIVSIGQAMGLTAITNDEQFAEEST